MKSDDFLEIIKIKSSWIVIRYKIIYMTPKQELNWVLHIPVNEILNNYINKFCDI